MKEMPKIIKDWIEALRSGEYTQTTKCLQDDNGFCCLGVLTDVCVKQKLVSKNNVPYKTNGQLQNASLPDSVVKATNITPYGWPKRVDSSSLVGLNDDRGWSFNQIADELEKNWSEYVRNYT